MTSATWRHVRAAALTFGLWTITATASAASISVTWTAPTENEDGSPLTDLSHYEIRYGCQQSGQYDQTVMVAAPATSTNVGGLPDVGSCWFVGVAVNDEGITSALSNEVSAALGSLDPPGPVENLVIEWSESTGGGPVAVVVESVTENFDQQSGAGSTIAVFPTTRPDGDLYLVVIGADDGDLVESLNGYTALLNSSISPDDFAGILYDIGDSEPATIDFDRSGGTEAYNVAVIRVSGIDATTQIGATSSLSEGSGTTITSPAITATSDDSLIFRVYYVVGDGVEAASYSGGTEQTRSPTESGSPIVGIAVTTEASPGDTVSTGTETATIGTTRNWAAITFEVMPAAGGGTAISGTTDSLSITEQAATVALATNIAAGVDSLSIAEQAASVNAANNIAATADALSISAQAASVLASTAISATVDALSLTAQAAAVTLGANIAANVDAFTITENAATVQTDTAISAGVQNLTLAEQVASILADTAISANTDALTLTEQGAVVTLGTGISANTATFTIAGQDMSFSFNIDANADSFSITANQASLTNATNISAGTQALTLAEQAASVLAASAIDASVDALTIDAKAASILSATRVDAATDAFTLTANAAAVAAGLNFSASVDTLSLTAQAATFLASTNISADVVALSLSELSGTVDSTSFSSVSRVVELAATLDVTVSLTAVFDPTITGTAHGDSV